MRKVAELAVQFFITADKVNVAGLGEFRDSELTGRIRADEHLLGLLL